MSKRHDVDALGLIDTVTDWTADFIIDVARKRGVPMTEEKFLYIFDDLFPRVFANLLDRWEEERPEDADIIQTFVLENADLLMPNEQ